VKELLLAIQQSPSGYNPSQKNLLVKNLISYVKTMHDCGIFHGELHAENILVNPNNTTIFYLLDLGRAQFTKKLPLSWRIQELSRLAYSIIDTCTNEEIKELITNYTNQLSKSKDREIFHKAVFKEVSGIKRRLWNSRARKCFKNNNVFKCTTHGNYKIHTRNEWEVNKLIDLIRNHNFSVKENLPGALKISAKIAITRLPASHETTESVCIKEYKYPSSFKRFLYSFCNSPARRAWFAAHGLIALNVKTPKPIALIEEKRFGILRKSFIITEDITASLPCNKYISETFHNPYDKTASGKKRIFLSCLAASFRQLHDSGIYHRDLKANNIMIMELPDTWNFFYLDLDRVCFDKTITLKKKIKNLSQLNASLPNCITYTDRLRFYRAYTGVESLHSENKRILQAIIQLSLHRKHVWNPKIQIPQVSQIN
jgi:tRNA A-37 threonylcarbamoyl transferase component Bud32